MAVRTGVLPDRYADPRVIGRGGMGEIYLAEDTELGRKVVVKVLDARFADHEDFRRRFKREALTAARLTGEPHTISIYDVGDFRGRPFIVMEYLAGGSLADRARNAPVPPHRRSTGFGRPHRRSTPRTLAEWCTATSSPRTCSSANEASSWWPTSESLGRSTTPRG